MSTVLDNIVGIIEQDAHSATALTLYALVSTMDYEAAGCMFKLNKLRDISPKHRQLAYELIELMVANGNRGEDWESAKQKMDAAVKQG